MEEKLRNFERHEDEKYATRQRICIIIATIVIVADILNLISFVLEYKKTYFYITFSAELLLKICDCILIISIAVGIYYLISYYLLKAMISNIEKESAHILFDYFRLHGGYVGIKVKYGCGVAHEAYDFITSSDMDCKLYAKSVEDKHIYIWVCDENGKELECWIETVRGFFEHFVAIEEDV